MENTAAWALAFERAGSWQAHILAAPALEATWTARDARVPYLRLLLSAHFTTVATLVPTDLDTHIRHHVWQEIESRDDLESALAAVDEAAGWDPRAVSARVVEVPGRPILDGHAGEWLSVRSGALGRALELGADDLAERLIADIERELAHEAATFAAARASGDAGLVLRVAATLAHNGGDLSRVVEAWKKTPRRDELIERFCKLGHERPSRWNGEHHLAGHVNKVVMATENHRFLPMRAARPLRLSRALVLPIAPFFDGWGEALATDPALDTKQRAEVLGVVLAAHDATPAQQSYLRGLAGLSESHKGGLDALLRELPAKARKIASSGPVREAIRTDRGRFEARMANALRAAMASYRS